jgi:Tfp pilus assembly protein PilO
MMKTRKVLIITLIIAILVAYYIIGTGYMNQRNQKGTLAAEIAEANTALALIPVPPADLDEQLADAEDKLWELEETLDIDSNIVRIVNRILRLAEDTGVKAIPLSTQPWATERYENQDYSVFRIDLAVSGNFTQMVDFLDRLENGEPETLVLEHVNIEKESGSFLFESPDEGWIKADIRIAVYTLVATD